MALAEVQNDTTMFADTNITVSRHYHKCRAAAGLGIYDEFANYPNTVAIVGPQCSSMSTLIPDLLLGRLSLLITLVFLVSSHFSHLTYSSRLT